jgi:gliding motility-associated-like protein
VPNVFSPNNDGKNDIFYVYGNYISKIELQIYNQWGQHITPITDKNKGWDGKFKGNPQPVGVYVYVLKVEMQDKREINMKGSITLVR